MYTVWFEVFLWNATTICWCLYGRWFWFISSATSNVKPHNLIDFFTHDDLIKGLSGPGFDTAFKHFAHKLTKNLYALNVCEKWTQMFDFLEFFQDHVIAIIETLYGTTLTSQHPNFVRDLWVFDKVMFKLAKRLPKPSTPEVYKLREKLLRDIKNWQAVVREKFDYSKIYKDGDEWRSELMRSRQKSLLNVKYQDYDSMTSINLDLIWTYGIVFVKIFSFWISIWFDLNWMVL